ncbi:MAG: F0F1 ATP synthase subunit B [Puniceicoccales bacterium]|nr:F0F1 ATP synthase subunit B [Puniceicoccales bacterium]
MFGIETVFVGAVMDALADVLENFGVHWQLLLIQSLNFLCVIGILYYLAFKPILKTMEERRAKIESGLRYAEEMRDQLAQSDATVREQLAQAREEARQIIEDAKRQAKDYADKQKKEIEQLTQNMITSAKQNIADEKAKMMADLKGEVKILVADVAAKVLARELSSEERTRYLDRAVLRL